MHVSTCLSARRHRRARGERRGTVAVLAAACLVFMMVLLAFAIDLGYLVTARTEMQRTADAAAMAGCWQLIDDGALTGSVDLAPEIYDARTMAVAYAAKNKVCQQAPVINANFGNSTSGDVVVGQLANPFDSTSSMTYANQNLFNAVQVKVNKSAASNGEVKFFIGPLLGISGATTQVSATAALLNNFSGFRAPSDSTQNLGILPFALDQTTWNDMLAGGGSDSWNWDANDEAVKAGSDGVREINLYPQGTGSPGNRGTVDIGGSNNSTADIARQIVDGVSAEDLSHHGGSLEFDASGKLYLNGDTGISAGVKDELTSIIGQPRIIPIFNSVAGPGNNAEYTIVQFAGVRILDVKLTGSATSKRVTIQPAKMSVRGGIPNTGGTTTSQFIYSPVFLVH